MFSCLAEQPKRAHWRACLGSAGCDDTQLRGQDRQPAATAGADPRRRLWWGGRACGLSPRPSHHASGRCDASLCRDYERMPWPRGLPGLPISPDQTRMGGRVSRSLDMRETLPLRWPTAGTPRRILLALGRMHVEAFAAQPHHYLLRFVDPPAAPQACPHDLVIDRGPFTAEGDRPMQSHMIDLVVCKNAGGTGTRQSCRCAPTQASGRDDRPPGDR